MAVPQQVFDQGLVRLPRRLGVVLKPRLKGLVLVSDSTRIIRPEGVVVDGLSSVIKVDQLKSTLDRRFNEGGPPEMAKLVRTTTIEAVARQLVALHRPVSTDWPARFGLPTETSDRSARTTSTSDRHDLAMVLRGWLHVLPRVP